MVASLSLLSLALSALSLVNARAVPRHTQPDDYVEGYLEKYSTYHERYLALQCYKKHDTPFFDLCCHPMLATENLKDNRDPSCDPANAESSPSSSSEAAPTTTEVTQSTTSEVTQSAPTEPAQPPAQFNNGGNNDNDDDFEDCDDEGEYDDDDEDLEDCEEEETGGQEQGQSQSAPTTQAPPPPPTTTAEQAPTTTSTTEQAPTTTSTTEQAPATTSTTEQAPTSTSDQTPTTTSTTEQAPTSTTEEQAPPTTAATTTTSEQSQPTQDNGNGNQGGNQGGDLQLGGFATWYEQHGNAGSCGDRHGDDELIAAIDQERYGDLGQKSGLCGQRVSITNNNNGKSVTVTIADVCPTCDNGNSIDLSVGAFKAIADLGDGHVPISWKFV